MRGADEKLRAVAWHKLGHLDAFILHHLLDRPDPNTSDQINAITKAVLIDIVDNNGWDVEGFEPTGWAARIVEFLPKRNKDGDSALFMSADRHERFVPDQDKAALREDVQRAAADLRKVRAMNQREIDKAYAAICETQLRTTKEILEADWALWLAKPSWTINETVALLFGKDPNDLNAKSKDLPGWARSAFAVKLDHLQRVVGAGNLKDPTTPQAVRKWATIHEPTSPAELHILPRTPDDRSESENDDEIHHHTLKIYHHILLYLAVFHHGYDPVAEADGNAPDKTAKSNAPTSISRALRNAGLEGSNKSIRKHLANAVAAFEKEHGYAGLQKLAKHRKLPSTKL